MRRHPDIAILMACAAAAAAFIAEQGAAQTGAAQTVKRKTPEWAYAIPPDGNGAVAVMPDDGTVYSLPGSAGKFTYSQIRGKPAPADWFPSDHPPMPKIVSEGDPARAIQPCSLCHYPNGQGRMENAGVSGLPKDYLADQLRDMKSGARRSAEPLKANAAVMDKIAAAMTEDEIVASSAYFAAIPWSPWIKVIESPTAPKTRNGAGLLFPLEGAAAGQEPIAGRIVEVPENPQHAEVLRDPHSGFLAYVPPGSVARGKALVAGEKAGSLACAVCHGEDLTGVGAIPSISGRSPSYIGRQLADFRAGTRAGAMAALMKPVVETMTDADITDIAAYLASRPVTVAKAGK